MQERLIDVRKEQDTWEYSGSTCGIYGADPSDMGGGVCVCVCVCYQRMHLPNAFSHLTLLLLDQGKVPIKLTLVDWGCCLPNLVD